MCLGAAIANAVPEEQRLNALAATLEGARIRGAYAGLHCCAAHPIERMCRVRPDIISFDAHEGLDSFFTDWHALDFMQQGGTVAYGIVPTRPGVNAVDSASIFLRWLKAASLAGDPQKFAQRAMITATCGLGLLDTSAVAESFGVAQSVSKLIRSLAGSPELEEEVAFENSPDFPTFETTKNNIARTSSLLGENDRYEPLVSSAARSYGASSHLAQWRRFCL
ncbi:MAG: hypothetical protein WAL56_24760 [Candidatus Sulfotelmatobacter sp.]